MGYYLLPIRISSFRLPHAHRKQSSSFYGFSPNQIQFWSNPRLNSPIVRPKRGNWGGGGPRARTPVGTEDGPIERLTGLLHLSLQNDVVLTSTWTLTFWGRTKRKFRHIFCGFLDIVIRKIEFSGMTNFCSYFCHFKCA